jgi:hypothetical protein
MSKFQNVQVLAKILRAVFTSGLLLTVHLINRWRT